MYWSDEVTHSVCRANKHNGGHLQVLLTDVSSPGGVAINQPVLQPDSTTNQKLLLNTMLLCDDRLKSFNGKVVNLQSQFLYTNSAFFPGCRAGCMRTYRDGVHARVCRRPDLRDAGLHLHTARNEEQYVSRKSCHFSNSSHVRFI